MASRHPVPPLCFVVLSLVVLGVQGIRLPEEVRTLLEKVNASASKNVYPEFSLDTLRKRGGDAVNNILNPSTGDADHRSSSLRHTTRTEKQQHQELPFPSNVQWLMNMFESGLGFPRSFDDVLPDGTSYWASQTYTEVGGLTWNNEPTPLDSVVAVNERILYHWSLNLFDGAYWEMALSLWGAHNVAYVYESEILYPATTGPCPRSQGGPGGIINLRADSDAFKYGPELVLGSELTTVTYPGNVTHFPDIDGKPGLPVQRGPGAYLYSALTPHYQLTDPMTGNYGNAWKYPWPNRNSDNTWNTYGEVFLAPWLADTFGNVLGGIIGPLQSLSIATNNDLTNFTCGSLFHVPAVQCDWKTLDATPPPMQLAISVLPAMLAMQTELGAMTHVPWDTERFPAGGGMANVISAEDDLLALAAVTMADDVLKNYTANSSDPLLLFAQTSFANLRTGLERWFNSDAVFSPAGQLPNTWRLLTNGHINASGYFQMSILECGGFDVEAQLFALSLLDLDATYGPGFSYSLWQAVVTYAGVWDGEVLLGVGPVNQLPPQGVPLPDSNTPWNSMMTFEAINAAQILAQRYPANASYWLQAAQSMYNQVTQPWPQGLRFPDGSFALSNKRMIAYSKGFMNPVGHLGSTSWSVMQEKNCDPLHWFCGNKPPLQPPPSTLRSSGGIVDKVEKELKGIFGVHG